MELINTIIASVALFLSGLSLFLHQRDKNPRLKVIISVLEKQLYGWYSSSNRYGSSICLHRNAPFVKINVQNRSEKDVTINSITVNINNKNEFNNFNLFPFSDDNYNWNSIDYVKSLNGKIAYIHGQDIFCNLPENLRQGKTKISLYIRLDDVIGNKYKSNSIRIDTRMLEDKTLNDDVENAY
jgi:hypothetical protein